MFVIIVTAISVLVCIRNGGVVWILTGVDNVFYHLPAPPSIPGSLLLYMTLPVILGIAVLILRSPFFFFCFGKSFGSLETPRKAEILFKASDGLYVGIAKKNLYPGQHAE